jgi:hypothetical protein
MTYEHKPSVVLAELWECESNRGNVYFSGFWGGLSVALLRDGERPHPTRPDEMIVVWRLVAQERQPRPAAQRPAASPPEREEAPAPPAPLAPSSGGARPGASQGPQRRFRRKRPGEAGAGLGRGRARPRRAGRRGPERPAAVLTGP